MTGQASEHQPPHVVELSPVPAVCEALRAVSHLPGVLLLDSALQREQVGRYSYLMADPIQTFQIDVAEFGVDPFGELEDRWTRLRTPSSSADLPPFQGGIAGLMGYELGRSWERIQTARHREFEIPELHAGLYDRVIAWDHVRGKCWIISHPWDDRNVVARSGEILKCLEDYQRCPAAPPALIARQPVFSDQLAPHWVAPGLPGLVSNFSRDNYLIAVARVIEYIHAGDIFQANLSQRLLFPQHELTPVELYERLRAVNPAPFAGLYVGDNWAVVSASPERFLHVEHGEVETRPIKGTRRRPSGVEADLFTQDELRGSEKDMAENVMIVDLMRNDLSRVCKPGTVRVPQLCQIESYRTVQHLVSEIRGELRDRATPWDLFRATFPGGSITGAPKVRAMEIIAELEPTARGPYTGCLFAFGMNGTVDSNLLIRTFVWQGGWLQCGVGGGIVAASEPEAEYEETLHKAAGMLQALR